MSRRLNTRSDSLTSPSSAAIDSADYAPARACSVNRTGANRAHELSQGLVVSLDYGSLQPCRRSGSAHTPRWNPHPPDRRSNHEVVQLVGPAPCPVSNADAPVQMTRPRPQRSSLMRIGLACPIRPSSTSTYLVIHKLLPV